MRISDWSSDVCYSDLPKPVQLPHDKRIAGVKHRQNVVQPVAPGDCTRHAMVTVNQHTSRSLERIDLQGFRLVAVRHPHIADFAPCFATAFVTFIHVKTLMFSWI